MRMERPCRRRPPISLPASARPATSATTRSQPSPSSRCGCSGRCCSRASPAPARPRSPRRSPRRSACRWSGCSATRASTPPRRSTTGTSRVRSCTCARSRRPGSGADVEEAEKSLYDERFLLARPVLQALQQSPAVLLVDEVDRADDEFEAFLLEVLSTYQVSIPELGTVAAATPPVVVLTSNRTRELHDALKRRCLYHWIEHPGLEREVADRPLPRARGLRGAGPAGRRDRPAAAATSTTCRSRRGSPRPSTGPGPCTTSAPPSSTSSRRPRTLGALVKYREDCRPGAAGARPDAAGMTETAASADEILLGFTRALRAAGVPVTHDRAHGFLGRGGRGGTRRPRGDLRRRPGHALRLTRRPERYDQVFDGVLQRPRRAAAAAARQGRAPRRSPGCRRPRATGRVPASRRPGGPGGGQRHRGAAAPRRRALSAAEKQRLAGLFATLRPRPPRRRTARHQRWHRGDVDAPRTLRASLRQLGEPAEIAWRRRGNKPRRVVLLVDVSGSMSGYADALLRLAHRFTQGAAGPGASSRPSPSAPG